jgi:hypothetical protein
MRKGLFFGILLLSVQAVFAQKTENSNKQIQLNEEIKTALVAKLQLSTEAADQVIVFETEFFGKLAAITALGEIPTKEKEKKLHEAHTVRRSKLMSIPLTGRQMEDVVAVVESIRRKHNL